MVGTWLGVVEGRGRSSLPALSRGGQWLQAWRGDGLGANNVGIMTPDGGLHGGWGQAKALRLGGGGGRCLWVSRSSWGVFVVLSLTFDIQGAKLCLPQL